ncbi:hypothetical protein QTG54_005003 [Skeletonema marinoi]|uniref:Uncharacterized protein n=1 Tax=Skeletonema marinoi TaxID=267567 RepID=A0AAD8YG68_9STRA|nr:hypothetical protein QTG54_005003 [Skeletonema marinoi]
MKNQQQQQQQRALEVTEQVHGKESTELTADGSSGIDGSLIITATTPTVTTTTSTLSTIDQQAYEEQFIKEPTGGETTTTYASLVLVMPFRRGHSFQNTYIKNELVDSYGLMRIAMENADRLLILH